MYSCKPGLTCDWYRQKTPPASSGRIRRKRASISARRAKPREAICEKVFVFVVDVVEDVGGELVVSEDRVLALEFELEVLCAASLCSRKMAFFERFVMSRLI